MDETYEILLGLRERYEAHHKLRYTDEALSAAAKFSSQYISDRFLPDKVRACGSRGCRAFFWALHMSSVCGRQVLQPVHLRPLPARESAALRESWGPGLGGHHH